MKSYWICCYLAATSWLCQTSALTVSPEVAHKIGERIWHNECGSTVTGLTCWNRGEYFASLGIGHFIWYPSHQKGPFQEAFPTLLAFLQQQGALPPEWLKSAQVCPWESREAFYAAIDSPKMQSLRQFLYQTKDLQALFIAQQLERNIDPMLAKCPVADRKHVTATFHRLAANAKGLYALIDYLNFKGSGISTQEAYQGQNWGLLQVLQRIPPDSKQPLADFITAAKEVLTARVQHAPAEKQEERWLKGWLNRIETYRSDD